MQESMEDRLQNLENRIKKLEAKEKRRTIFAIIKTVIIIAALTAVIIVGVHVYNEFMEKIQPIMEISEKAEDFDIKSIIGNYIK